MTTSTTRPTMQPLTPASKNSRRRAGRFIAGILCAAAVFTFAVHNVGSRTAVRQTDLYSPGSAHAPGGSVYNEQVPAAARQADPYGPGSAYAPGGSVYNEQVPAAARQADNDDPGSTYAPGGSMYNEQVPAAAR
jgi:hypothetical protein